MNSAADPSSSIPSQDRSADTRTPRTTRQVCPFCGNVNEKTALACPQCGMEDTPGTRQATRSRIGPWCVLQIRNPAAPGMNFATLQSLIQKGRVNARSIIRGPTTHQLWRQASKVKGVAREFGVCWGCGASINNIAKVCPSCKRLQEPPVNPDVLVEGQDLTVAAPAGQTPASRSPMPSVQLIDLQRSMLPAEVAVLPFGNDYGRRPRRTLRVVLLLSLILATAVGFLSVLDPPFWQDARNWLAEQWNQSSKPATDRPAAVPASPGRTAPAPPVDPSGEVVHIGPHPETRETPPANVPPTRSGSTGSAEVKITPAPPMTLDAAKKRAAELRVQAFAAHNARDYAKALRCWEEMKSLPKEAWHSDLDIQLEEARRMVP